MSTFSRHDNVLKGSLNPADDEVIDFLSSYKFYIAPNKDNIKSVIWELAYQEIIQKLHYIANCWMSIISLLKQYTIFQSPESLVNFCIEKRPSAKKVIEILDAKPCSDAERAGLLDQLKEI